MILNKYIISRLLKTHFAILFILLFLFECQQFIRLLSHVIQGRIPAELLLTMSLLNIPKMLDFTWSLSWFLAILFGLSSLYEKSEIIVMQACGASKYFLLKIIGGMTLIIGLIALINTFWLTPMVETYKYNLLEIAKNNPSLVSIPKGKFVNLTSDSNMVVFTENSKRGNLQNIYIFQLQPLGQMQPSVVTAATGNMQLLIDNTRQLNLFNVKRFEGVPATTELTLSNFEQVTAFLDYNPTVVASDNLKQLNINQLWQKYPDTKFKAEFIWRWQLAFISVIMAIIAVPLSVTNNRQGKYANILPAILLYVIYILGQNALKMTKLEGILSNTSFMCLLSFVFILIGLYLNYRNSFKVWLKKRRNTIK